MKWDTATIDVERIGHVVGIRKNQWQPPKGPPQPSKAERVARHDKRQPVRESPIRTAILESLKACPDGMTQPEITSQHGFRKASTEAMLVQLLKNHIIQYNGYRKPPGGRIARVYRLKSSTTTA